MWRTKTIQSLQKEIECLFDKKKGKNFARRTSESGLQRARICSIKDMDAQTSCFFNLEERMTQYKEILVVQSTFSPVYKYTS